MTIEKTNVVRTRESITPEEYGEKIAKEVVNWYLDDTTVDNVEFDDDEEIELVAIEIIRTLVDCIGLSQKVKIVE